MRAEVAMESMDCDSDPDVASPDSPMQHSGWESCQRAVSNINTIAAFRKSPTSTTVAYKPPVPQPVAMVTQDNFENQFHSNLRTPESNWNKCRNVFSAMNSFSGFRAHEALSPKESEKSMEGFSDGDDDGQVTMVTNSVPRFQDRSEIVNSVNPFSTGTMSGSMASFFGGLISKTSTDKSEPVMNTGIIDHGTSLGNEESREKYSSASHRLSKRHSVPFQSPARSSPKRLSLEPKSDRKGKHHSQPPPRMPRLSENVQEGHRSSPLRSLCKPTAEKKRKLSHHTTRTTSDTTSKSHRVTSKSFIVFNIFLGMCLSVYALKVIQSTCSTFADFDVSDLKRDLRSKVYGQHLATEIIPDLINRYLTEMHQRSSQKPLVISLHGWTGVGKNYVSKIVSDFFPYTTVNKLLVPLHFPHSSQDDVYAQQIPEWIETNITRCYINFVIFDEMDKASDGVLQGLNESVNMIVNQNATDTPVIFLLLSNSKGAEINKHVFQLLSAGRHRDDITIDDFSHVFQTEKPLWYTKFVPQRVVDVFVPFLPLERYHTVQCIKKDIVKKGLNVDKKAVSDVVQEMSFFKLNSGKEFSHTGCKRVCLTKSI
ncbi:torsin-4A-like [Haliotis rubra]|uniref:torsin-4A-like n=1 Tax=Haliotis rubra TaxID=36100 RepID=UPI001EE5A68B|nr:torsin-4A-like [Haliotis rubra]XP_046577460.1 torsin-4A-like [Haliotis rubra]